MLDRMLFDEVPGLPNPQRPAYWMASETVQKNLLRVSMWMAHYRDKLPPGTHFDEVAVLLPGHTEFCDLHDMLVANGWSLFNEAEDLVTTSPFGTRYGVHYSFFNHPDYGYRIEAMRPVSDPSGKRGFSPLHAALWVPNGVPGSGVYKWPMPHVSFKAADQTQRGYSMAVQHLRDNGCIHAMSCQSTYGAFGYFLGVDTSQQIYIKPRVNLRDA